MKLIHHPSVIGLRSDPITPAYQAEVDRSTDKATRAYQRAQRKLEAAERRLTKAERAARAATQQRRTKQLQRELAVAAELVELRREESLHLEALLKTSPYSAEHRGNRSFRPVPQPGGQF